MISFNNKDIRKHQTASSIVCHFVTTVVLSGHSVRFPGVSRFFTGCSALVLVLVCLTGTTFAKTEIPLTIGEITIVGNNIFSDDEIVQSNPGVALMRKAMNGLHVNTKEYVVRHELLFKAGELYDPALLAETERNLRELGFLNQISVTATDTTSDGQVNVKVNVRESWTLQTAVSYSLASGGNQRWSVKLSDDNFLGHGMTLGVGAGETEDTSYWSLWGRKRRAFDSKFIVGVDYAQRKDGHHRSFFVQRPFYSQADAWGMFANAYDTQSERRFFLSNAGRAGINPTENTRLYALLPVAEQGMDLAAIGRLAGKSSGRIWRIGAGIRISDSNVQFNYANYELSDDRITNLSWVDGSDEPLASKDGTTVFPYLWIQSQGRQWIKANYLLQYGPVEDIALGVFLDLKMGPTGNQIGSTNSRGARYYGEADLGKWTKFASGHLLTRLYCEGSTGQSKDRYHLFFLTSGWMKSFGQRETPWLTRIFAEIGHGSRLPGTDAIRLGLGRGLRTLDYDGMAGDRLVRWNVEQGKVLPWDILGLFQLGVAAFYDGGCAWWNDEQRDLANARHEVGFGIRFGPTRSANAQIARIDLGWPLDGSSDLVITAQTRGYF